MKDSALVKAFRRLSQGAKQSVQSGIDFDDFDSYMHIDRPIEKAVRVAMDEIRQIGGGIVLLVGSAGDGKSHLISTLKRDYQDFLYKNDASESPWPTVSSIDALKRHMSAFKDQTLHTTTSKLLVAINMGKLNAYIDDKEVRSDFSIFVECVSGLFNEDGRSGGKSNRIKVVSFSNHQLFELYPARRGDEYPVDSFFLREALRKITNDSDGNDFFASYKNSTPIGDNFDPCYVNYQFLCMPEVQDTIVMIVIEAIVRFKLILTPRDFFDFIYRIIVPNCYSKYTTKEHFFQSLLPNLLYTGGDNKILKCLAKLDPLKYGCIEHNDFLSDLFASTCLPNEDCYVRLKDNVHHKFFDITDEYFKNNRRNTNDISRLLFRIKHLMDYHSESIEYKNYLHLLCCFYDSDADGLYSLYDIIQRSISHFYGSYKDDTKLVPLNIQGRNYKFFVSSNQLKMNMVTPISFDTNGRFSLEICTGWSVNKNIWLKVDFSLYEFLCKIQKGKLVQDVDRQRNLAFSDFINKIVALTDFKEKVLIVGSDGGEYTLAKVFGNKITLQ